MVNSALDAVFYELLAGRRGASLARQTGIEASHDSERAPTQVGRLPPIGAASIIEDRQSLLVPPTCCSVCFVSLIKGNPFQVPSVGQNAADYERPKS